MDEDATACHECKDPIYPYEEKVHVWTIPDHHFPGGFRQVFLCEDCHVNRLQ